MAVAVTGRDILTVPNWAKWQSYRKDRGAPKWIKAHLCALRNPKWVALSDAQRGQIVTIWMLASEEDGQIDVPSGTLEVYIQRVGLMSSVPDLASLEAVGLVEVERSGVNLATNIGETVTTSPNHDARLPNHDARLPNHDARLPNHDARLPNHDALEESRGDQRREEEIQPIDRQPVDRRRTEDTEFDAFWSAYPRKIGKGAARKAWARATGRPHVAAMIANIRAHVDSDQWQRDGGQFIPHPATWLNQKRWDDEPGPQAGSIPTELERHNAAVAERFINRGGAS